MTYLDLLRDAVHKLDKGDITLGEYDRMLEPLNREIQPERKTGRWKVLDECSNKGIYCSECHKKVFKINYSNTMKWKNFRFCPNCGARMEGAAHEN